jgi:hypothetical protein
MYVWENLHIIIFYKNMIKYEEEPLSARDDNFLTIFQNIVNYLSQKLIEKTFCCAKSLICLESGDGHTFNIF